MFLSSPLPLRQWGSAGPRSRLPGLHLSGTSPAETYRSAWLWGGTTTSHLSGCSPPASPVPRQVKSEEKGREGDEKAAWNKGWSWFDQHSWGVGLAVVAHLLLGLAALGAEASNRGAFPPRRLELAVAPRGLFLQLVGQVMEDACTVLHRLEERRLLSSLHSRCTFSM